MGPAAVFQNNTKLCSVNHESWQGSNKGLTPDVSDTWTVTKGSCISPFLLFSKTSPLILWLMLSFHLLGKISEALLKLVQWQSWVSGVGLPCRLSFGQLPLHSFRFILRQLHLGFLLEFSLHMEKYTSYGYLISDLWCSSNIQSLTALKQ